MDKDKFLVGYVKFSGWLEIAFGVLFLCFDPISRALNIPNFVFFNVFSGITMIFLGGILTFSARDLRRYLVIPVSSCLFRYVVVSAEIVGVISAPILAPIFIGGLTYDIFSATLTLILLKRCGFFERKE